MRKNGAGSDSPRIGMPTTSYIVVGAITKAHGIRGEVSVNYHADSPRLLEGPVYLQKGNAALVPRTVAGWRKNHGMLLVRFAEITDRTAAETLRGFTLLVPESRLPEPVAGEVYLHQLLNLAVVALLPGGCEKDLGRISHIAVPAGQELWTISRDGETDILFPAVPEFVLSLDLKAGIARISPPPGLVELYRP